MFNFNQVKTNNVTNKTFNYAKGKVTLNFTLRTDVKNELKDFLELLKVAQEEVKNEIEHGNS